MDARQQLARRKQQVFVAFWIASVFLFIVNAGAWWHYLRTKEAFQALHSEKLLAVTHTVAYSLDPESLQALQTNQAPQAWKVQHDLRNLREINALGALFLIDTDHQILFDTRSDLPAGAHFAYLGQDTLLCLDALQGHDAVGPPHRIDNEPFRVATVPLWGIDANGDPVVAGVLGAEAAASYLATLHTQENLLIGFGLLSIFGLVIIIGVLGNSVSALIKAQDALSETEELALVGRLAPAIAHEIRNPLEIIKGSADVIRRRYAEADSADELFEFIPTEVARIDRLISEFLLLARPASLLREEVDLEPIIRRVVAGLEPRLIAAGISCEISGFDTIPRGFIDPDRIEQVLLNLVMNALISLENSSAEDRSIAIRADSLNWRGRSALRLAVLDNGPGIDPAVAPHVFEPFFTTRGSGGSGLGLTIARKIARDHNGDLVLESPRERGTLFILYLPLR